MQLSFPNTGFLRRLGITEVQAVQPGRCESQAATQSSSCASHTWNRVKTAATYSAPASGLHSQDERWRTRHDHCWSLCPSTDESGGGCEGAHKKVKTPQRNPEDRRAGKLYFFQVACPCVSVSVNPKHYVPLQERKVLNICRDRYLTVIQGVLRETVKFLSCPQD